VAELTICLAHPIAVGKDIGVFSDFVSLVFTPVSNARLTQTMSERLLKLNAPYRRSRSSWSGRCHFAQRQYETNFSSQWTQIENLVRRENTPTYSLNAVYLSEETN
jgi:hypothetical protein